MSQLIVKFPASPWGEDDRVMFKWFRVADLESNLLHEEQKDGYLACGESLSLDAEPGIYLVDVTWRSGRFSRHQVTVWTSNPGTVEICPSTDDKKARGAAARKGPSHAVVRSQHGPESWRYLEYKNKLRSDISEASGGQIAHRIFDQTLAHSGDDSKRDWLVYKNDHKLFMAALPFAAGSGHGTSAVLRSHPEGLPYLAFSGGDDSVMGDLLRSGNSGSEQAFARVTLSSSKRSPEQHLLEDPLSFCAYVFPALDVADARLAVLESADMDPRWPPDLFIALGWRKVFAARTKQEHADALHLIKVGVDAGVPYYSRSVRLLSEAVHVLEDLTEVEPDLVSLVNHLCHRINPDETFTTISID